MRFGRSSARLSNPGKRHEAVRLPRPSQKDLVPKAVKSRGELAEELNNDAIAGRSARRRVESERIYAAGDNILDP